MNGRLDKLPAQFESDSRHASMTPCNSSDRYCRVGAYAMPNGSDLKQHDLAIWLRKDTGAVGRVKLGDDATSFALATAVGLQAGDAIDTAARCIGFMDLGLGDAGAALKLNDTLAYPTHVDASNRAACG